MMELTDSQASMTYINLDVGEAADHINIAIASHERSQRAYLRMAMEANGLSVVLNDSLSESFIEKLLTLDADVLLLDMYEDEHSDELINTLLEQIDIPILFNDVTGLRLNDPNTMAQWYGKLMRKIAALTGRDIQPPLQQEEIGSSTEILHILPLIRGDIARDVWVLGSSLGGPEALKRFLGLLPADLPVALVLAQHLGANFVSLLAEQLDRTSAFRVMAATEGHVLRHGEVVVVPVNERVLINPIGAIQLKALDATSPYTPSIDKVVSDIAARYKARSGAIIFSGMCDDGRMGCQVMRQYGGQVWVQDAESCVISSMPDSVRDTGVVSYLASPEALAENLVRALQNSNSG